MTGCYFAHWVYYVYICKYVYIIVLCTCVYMLTCVHVELYLIVGGLIYRDI